MRSKVAGSPKKEPKKDSQLSKDALSSYNEKGKSFALEGAMSILLIVLLFQLNGCDNPHDIPDSNSCILGLSNEVSFDSGLFLKGGQSSQNVLLKTFLYVYICRSVYVA